MNNRQRLIAGAGILLMLCVFSATMLFRSLQPYPAPKVVFKTITGEKIALSELRGQPVIINFWASTCGYCLEEMPHLANLYRELSPKGFKLIGIAMPYDMPSQVVQISKQLDIPYAVAIDPDDTVARAFGNVRFTPTSFLIDANGMIIDKTTGRMDLDDLRNRLDQLLGD